MDISKLTEVLRASINPDQRQQAEEQLAQIHKIIGFAPSLLQVVMSAEVEMPVRQAGVIYLKNMITQNWLDQDDSEEPLRFRIHEQDRAIVRESIIDAIVQSPDIVKLQLALCARTIIKNDFPGCWTQIVDKIGFYLGSADASTWSGALLALYQLVKNYEYSKAEERVHLIGAMQLLLPIVHRLVITLFPDPSDQSLLLQKQIMKIFFALIQYSLPLDLITKETFSQWMDVMRMEADKPIPEATLAIDEDERVEHPSWKCKKWALHTLHRIFERYGSPGVVSKEYREFADWYLKTFSGGILEVLLKILDQYRNKVYVSPRVLQQTLNYITQCVSHAHSWNFLKPHMFAIIQDVLFPIMSYSDADEELWDSDPHEYVRVRFDIFEDFVSPVTAAQALLLHSCKKRKDMLQRTMQLCMQVLTGQIGFNNPRQKDGALHMIGALAEVLLKKKIYKDEIDTMLVQYVFPEFTSTLGYMRARACWVIHHFAEMKVKNEEVLVEALRLIVNALLTDTDLPVKVEAAIALQMLLSSHEKAEKYLEPQVNVITLELLNLIRETENDDITTVMQKLVCSYTEQLMPIAVEICSNLATTFNQVLEADAGSDEKAITSMGLLNTIETLVNVMSENEEVMRRLEPCVLQVVGHIFQTGVIEFYEEAFSLVYDLTSKTISPDMWKVLELVYTVFQKDGFDYFTDMMPALHNYVTIDSPAFLSNENHILAVFNMCKAVLTGDSGEDPECYAAKLLEVIILQCKGQIDRCIPVIVELVLGRLTREVKTSELRTMCLQVVIAALYYNPQLLLSILDKPSTIVPTESITSHFIKQWIHDTDCFFSLHDRKMCVLGLCTLLSLGPIRPPLLNESIQKIMPACIILFDGLKRAYMARAAEEAEEESEEEEDTDDGEEVLSTDDDEIDDQAQDYLESLARKVKKEGAKAGLTINDVNNDENSEDSDYEGDEDYDALDETPLESYTTPLDEADCPVDEYIVFKEVITKLSASEPAFYSALTVGLTGDQNKALQDIFTLADQRCAQQESKRIEQSGGYSFVVPPSVPTTFKFGS